MSTHTVFMNKRCQAIRWPAHLRLPEGIEQVVVRALAC
jgi:virulence-associated protein VagC